jgi:hypothetical protein
MKTFTMGTLAVFAILLISLPLAAQGSRSGGGDRGSGGSSVGSSGADTRGTAADTSSSSRSDGVSRDFSSGSPSMGYSPRPAFNLNGTSFDSLYAYYSWNDFYSYLSSRYFLNSFYFSRFYRNSEPLITPALLKLTLREPLSLSSRMLASIDQLEQMVRDVQAGKDVDKQALAAKSNEIRDLAKEIRQNQTLARWDLRKEADLYKGDSLDILSPEAFDKLREMAVDLNRQLTNIYNQSSTSTVSLNSFNEPSLASLAKGIERMSKAIGSSSKRM